MTEYQTSAPGWPLYFGRPAGSAMPLVWAHAEYVKLRRSLRDGAFFDHPPQPVQRYQVEKLASPFTIWRFNHKCRLLPIGQTLRIELLTLALVHWSANGWQTATNHLRFRLGPEVAIALGLRVKLSGNGDWLDPQAMRTVA